MLGGSGFVVAWLAFDPKLFQCLHGSSVARAGQGRGSCKNELVSDTTSFLAWAAAGKGGGGGRGWQRQKRIGGRHYFVFARAAAGRGGGGVWGQGWAKAKTN